MSKKHRGRIKSDPVTYQLPTPAGGVQMETFVPWTLVKRGFKKQIITPLDAPQEFLSEATREREAREAAQDSALMRALGLAYHWQRLLDEQRVASVAEIAEAEGIDVTQVRRVMRMTLLGPEVVERLIGTPDDVLEKVMRRPWPNVWSDQARLLTAHGAVRAIDAAVSWSWLEDGVTLLALIEPLARVGGHCFDPGKAALRTSQRRFQGDDGHLAAPATVEA